MDAAPDRPATFSIRVPAHGRFVFPAASNHGYVVGTDDEWACELWAGVILASDEAEPADVTLEAYRATPLTVRVTWGPNAEPWNGPFLNVEQAKDLEWTDVPASIKVRECFEKILPDRRRRNRPARRCTR